MKRFFLTVVSLLIVSAAFADAQSDKVLSKLAAAVKSLGDYRVEFTIGVEGNDLTGAYVVSGNRYYMKTDDYEVVCDGLVKYEINSLDEEVLVDGVNPADRSLLSNPTRAFDFLGASFKAYYKGEESAGGVLCDVIRLKPNDLDSPYSEIEVSVNRKTSLPVSMVYMTESFSDDVVVAVRSIASERSVDESLFKFDRSKYKGYEIIDFR